MIQQQAELIVPFRLGTFVFLDSGCRLGARLTAFTVREGNHVEYECRWFINGELKTGWFNPAQLTKIPDEEKNEGNSSEASPPPGG